MGLTEVEVLGLEIKREIRAIYRELKLKKEALKHSRKQLSEIQIENSNTKESLAKLQRSHEELKASLVVRNEAIKRLEIDNAQMRDTLACASVQNELYVAERQLLLERSQRAESDAGKMRERLEELEKREESDVGLREQVLQMQLRLQKLLNMTDGQLGELKKDHIRIEKAHQEGLAMAQAVKKFSEVQNNRIKLIEDYSAEIEEKLQNAYEELDVMRCKIKESQSTPIDVANHGTYLEDWKTYQEKVALRLQNLKDHNERLVEEISLLRKEKNVSHENST